MEEREESRSLMQPWAAVTPGCARLEVESVCGMSAATAAYSTSPLKLLVPRSRGTSVWAYTSSFGGGLVAGDQTRLELRIGPGARCFVGTQASTKIYRNPKLRPCSHATHGALSANSLLVFAPDPVQAFAGSAYSQRQEFRIAPGAGLVLLDWFTAGRAARGERWAFQRFQSRNEVWQTSAQAMGDRPLPLLEPTPSPLPGGDHATGASNETPLLGGAGGGFIGAMRDSISENSLPAERILLDSLVLDSETGALDDPHRTGRFNCFALAVIMGSPVSEIAARCLESISQEPVVRRAALVFSASPVRDGVLLRVAGESAEQVGRELHRHLKPLCDLLGDDPWGRKW
jgi:urease accessory protein